MAVQFRNRDANEQRKIAILVPISVVQIFADGHLLISDFPSNAGNSVPQTLQHKLALELNESIGKSFSIYSSLYNIIKA